MRSDRHHRRVLGALAAVFLALASGCSRSEGDPGAESSASRAGVPTHEDIVEGPLCDQLPAGDDPGAPRFLEDMPADEALTWMPVLTIFEAAARATGLDADLRRADGI